MCYTASDVLTQSDYEHCSNAIYPSSCCIYNTHILHLRNMRTQLKLVLIFLLVYILDVAITFRFCLDGAWHQTGLTQKCEYGIAFFRPVPLYCAYENFQDEALRISFQSDACVDERFRMDDFQGYNPDEAQNFAHNLPDLQVIYYHKGDETNAVTKITRESPDVVDLNECLEMCGKLPSLESTDSSSSEEERVLDQAETLKIKEQTLRLGDYMYDITFSSGNNLELDYRIVDLFRRSFDVLSGACPNPYIPNEFRSRVLNGFLYLLSDSGTESLHDITDEEYQDIKDGLEACMSGDYGPNFELKGTVCSSKASVETIIHTDDDGRQVSQEYQQDNNTDYYRYDLFIDSAWKVIDIVNAVCFVHFKPNANMHHRYQTAMEELFTPQMLRRWLNPTQLINTDAWGSWFLVDINSTILNLYACQRAAYIGTPFSMRLDRPFEKHRFKRDLSRQLSRGSSRKLSRAKRAGTFVSQDYWEQYEQEGGIEAKLRGSIYCFKHPEGTDQSRNEILALLNRTQCGIV